jgi:O-antigen/teichoic acid export membrane protein
MQLISHKKLAHNTFYNLLGKALPISVGILVIPILIDKMGLERFGVLTLVWSVIGYFGVFDLGIGRATTKFAAAYLARNQVAELPALIWTSVFFMFFFGLIGGVLAYFLSPWLVTRVFNVSPNLVGETRRAFQLLACTIPFVISTAGTVGVLEAQQRFGLINAIRTPASLINFLAPLPILLFTQSLYPLVAVMAGTRVLVWLAFFYLCLNSLPNINRVQAPSRQCLKKLLGFGGWITISSLVGPVMIYMDRFLIGALLTMQAVAYYVTPYELATKLLHIPSSLAPVLFPAFSAYAAGREPELAVLYRRAVKYLFLALAPCTAAVIVLAQPFLSAWINPGFAKVSAPILQLLAVGVMLNAIAWVTQGVIHALGRPDLTAKLHLAELPVYLGLMWIAIHHLGLIGVALVWVVRVGIDSALLYWWKNRLLAATASLPLTFEPGLLLGALSLLGGAVYLTLTPSLPLKISGLALIILGMGFLAWQYLLDDREKGQIYLTKNKVLKFLA